jgi:hypothetical protein
MPDPRDVIPSAACFFARMMHEQDGHPFLRERVQGREGLQKQMWMVLFAGRQEVCQWIDDHQVEAARGLLGFEHVNELQPIGLRRAADEGPAVETIARAEAEMGVAFVPEVGGLLGDDGAGAGGDRAARQRSAGLPLREEVRQEGRLAGLPDTGEQGDLAGREVAVPDPSFGLGGLLQLRDFKASKALIHGISGRQSFRLMDLMDLMEGVRAYVGETMRRITFLRLPDGDARCDVGCDGHR